MLTPMSRDGHQAGEQDADHQREAPVADDESGCVSSWVADAELLRFDQQFEYWPLFSNNWFILRLLLYFFDVNTENRARCYQSYI